jgi:hypothetical protein
MVVQVKTGGDDVKDAITLDKHDVAAAAGWALLAGFLSRDEAAALQRDVAALAAAPDNNLECMYFFGTDASGERRLTRIERIWEALPTLLETGLGERISARAEAYLGEPVVLFKDKLNIRYSGSAGYAPHQDSAAGWEDFAAQFVSIGVFLGRSDPFHGGFEVVDGAHRSGRFANEKGRMSDADFEALGPEAVRANLGDAILLDSEAPHRTLRNDSSTDSLHLLFTFAPARAGGIRDLYYEKKAASFAQGRKSNRFEFRVFAF